MSFSEELKVIRQHSFLSRETFSRKLNVSFSSVNRWEFRRARPNLVAMKSIKSFCKAQGIDFFCLEKEWHKISNFWFENNAPFD